LNPDLAPAGRALLFAPIPGDAHALATMLQELGLTVRVCSGPQDFYEGLAGDVWLAVVTEEALLQCEADAPVDVLRRQPPWSDIPLLALAGSGAAQGGAAARVDSDRFARLAGLGNFTLIERPTSRQVLLMALRSALRARHLQYAVREHWRELELHASRLEAAVEERTLELEHEVRERSRVEAALEEARRLESLGRLTGGVAHDFNNVLQVIAGSVTLIRLVEGNDIDPRIQRALESIHRAAERGASLTQRLLAYARRQPLANVTLDLDAHLHATADMLLRSLGQSVELELSVPQGLWQVEADPSQLDAAILNIAGNARDAMPEGGRLLLAARNASLPDPGLAEAGQLAGDYVCLSFTDNGAGMSDEVARLAFEPFYTTKAVGKGTGLGLSQVYGFAIQSGGQAFIRRERAGTTIGLLLPRSTAAVPAPEPAVVKDVAGDLSGVRLLCVEDDPDVVASTLALLQSMGASVALARNADAVLGRDLGCYDLVLSDVMMPGNMDGIGLAGWLNRHHPDLPVVLCSGYMLEPERLQSLKAEFLRKPYGMSELVDAIRRALKRSCRADESPR
jgi:signal transduction histidine kinase/CheY-like chemotaxis protein